ncbi:MAG TPA: Gfo/Idh/MocA family oxidoreductase [Propionibacteriaceae bacterium]|nr:Gfo/Idh/MocA family oxidoreductase [Propionibacteriaceae bacterium]
MTTTVAVVGCGDVSVVHFGAIEAIPDSQLVAVCDADPSTATAMSERHGVPAFSDHTDLLDSLTPDVVHICTPHHQHTRPAVDCLSAGVNVILEKPVAHTLAEAEEVVAAAERNPQTKIGVCLQNRYNATSQAAHELIGSGRLGAVVGGSGTVLWRRTADYYRARPWRGRAAEGGGGVLINQAIHTLDLLQWLIGDVAQVRGGTGRYALEGVIEVEDTAQMILDHVNGARSVFFATNANAVDAPVALEIITEEATLFVRGDLTVSYHDGRVETVAERRASSAGRSYWGVSHELLIADFYSKLKDPEPFWISPREASKSLQILKAVYQDPAS